MKQTLKEATLNHLKDHIESTGSRIFTVRQLTDAKGALILQDAESRSKWPQRTIDKVCKDLKDLKILRLVSETSKSTYEYILDNKFEEYVYKDRRSNGHVRIVRFLEGLNLQVQEEKTFSDLIHKSFLRFDIYTIILSVPVAIEYDGAQHSQAVEIWGGDDSLQVGKKRDSLKGVYCRENRIWLIRINHTIKDIEGFLSESICRLIFVALFVLVRNRRQKGLSPQL